MLHVAEKDGINDDDAGLAGFRLAQQDARTAQMVEQTIAYRQIAQLADPSAGCCQEKHGSGNAKVRRAKKLGEPVARRVLDSLSLDLWSLERDGRDVVGLAALPESSVERRIKLTLHTCGLQIAIALKREGGHFISCDVANAHFPETFEDRRHESRLTALFEVDENAVRKCQGRLRPEDFGVDDGLPELVTEGLCIFEASSFRAFSNADASLLARYFDGARDLPDSVSASELEVGHVFNVSMKSWSCCDESLIECP